MSTNYQLELEKILDTIDKSNKPKLLLHACCAPCSSYVVEYLKDYFDITLFFYNPNISSKEEYEKRLSEFKKIQNKFGKDIKVINAEYNEIEFYEKVKGFENEKEGGDRCFICYRLRLEKTALYAKENNFDYFASTLSISPHKKADKINDIGIELSKVYNINYLCNDFKKNGGYLRSIELSKELELYRQNYCGCIFSMR